MKRCLYIIHWFVLGAFFLAGLGVPKLEAGEVIVPLMPKPGAMVSLSRAYTPAQLNGIIVHPDNALLFDFLVQKGDGRLDKDQKELEYTKLVKYFLASLAVPEADQWVNLSPYEHQRIINDNFGKTEMGRDLLTQDYLLKQITSSLMYPESGLGKEFWDKVYAKAFAKFGNTNIPLNTFNKVWIVPQEAVVYESGNTAYILKSHLKVMMEEDYLAVAKNQSLTRGHVPGDEGVRHVSPSTLPSELQLNTKAPQGDSSSQTLTSKAIREIILPILEKEVNEGKNFAQLRQVFSGMVLATWYKRALKESLLGKIYADKAKIRGVDLMSSPNASIGDPVAVYKQYLAAFKKGVYNYIKEDEDKSTHQIIPRKYFSGGFDPAMKSAMAIIRNIDAATAHILSFFDRAVLSFNDGSVDSALTNLMPLRSRKNISQERPSSLYANLAMSTAAKWFAGLSLFAVMISGAVAGTSVVVQKGNTLSELVQIHGNGAKINDVARMNNIKNPNVIQIGQVINFPDAHVVSTSPEQAPVLSMGTAVENNPGFNTVQGDNVKFPRVRNAVKAVSDLEIGLDNQILPNAFISDLTEMIPNINIEPQGKGIQSNPIRLPEINQPADNFQWSPGAGYNQGPYASLGFKKQNNNGKTEYFVKLGQFIPDKPETGWNPSPYVQLNASYTGLDERIDLSLSKVQARIGDNSNGLILGHANYTITKDIVSPFKFLALMLWGSIDARLGGSPPNKFSDFFNWDYKLIGMGGVAGGTNLRNGKMTGGIDQSFTLDLGHYGAQYPQRDIKVLPVSTNLWTNFVTSSIGGYLLTAGASYKINQIPRSNSLDLTFNSQSGQNSFGLNLGLERSRDSFFPNKRSVGFTWNTTFKDVAIALKFDQERKYWSQFGSSMKNTAVGVNLNWNFGPGQVEVSELFHSGYPQKVNVGESRLKGSELQAGLFDQLKVKNLVSQSKNYDDFINRLGRNVSTPDDLMRIISFMHSVSALDYNYGDSNKNATNSDGYESANGEGHAYFFNAIKGTISNGRITPAGTCQHWADFFKDVLNDVKNQMIANGAPPNLWASVEARDVQLTVPSSLNGKMLNQHLGMLFFNGKTFVLSNWGELYDLRTNNPEIAKRNIEQILGQPQLGGRISRPNGTLAGFILSSGTEQLLVMLGYNQPDQGRGFVQQRINENLDQLRLKVEPLSFEERGKIISALQKAVDSIFSLKPKVVINERGPWKLPDPWGMGQDNVSLDSLGASVSFGNFKFKVKNGRIVDVVYAIPLSNSNYAMRARNPGGIDFNASHFGLGVERNGAGVKMPLMSGDLAMFSGMRGLEPRIIEIKTLKELPALTQAQRQIHERLAAMERISSSDTPGLAKAAVIRGRKETDNEHVL